jgi:hypothetical protein
MVCSSCSTSTTKVGAFTNLLASELPNKQNGKEEKMIIYSSIPSLTLKEMHGTYVFQTHAALRAHAQQPGGRQRGQGTECLVLILLSNVSA